MRVGAYDVWVGRGVGDWAWFEVVPGEVNGAWGERLVWAGAVVVVLVTSTALVAKYKEGEAYCEVALDHARKHVVELEARQFEPEFNKMLEEAKRGERARQ